MTTSMRRIAFGFAALLAASAAHAATDQGAPHRVAVKGGWSVFQSASPTACWATSAPKSSVNTRNGKVAAVNRGDIQLFVTFRQNGDPDGGLSFTGGYPFADKTAPVMAVGGQEYAFITQGEWAWPKIRASQSGLLDALKQGMEATITAYSVRGTKTEDTFTLQGLSAAIDEAKSTCSGI